MNVNSLIQHIRFAHKANNVLMVWGAPGIGKSAASQEAADILATEFNLPGGVIEYGDDAPEGFTIDQCFGVIDVRLSQCDPVDVGGLPYKTSRQTQGRLVPDWFPSTDRADMPERGLLLLEEIVSAPLSVQAAAYQLTHDRRIGDKVMKPGWSIVMTGNRLTDGGVVFKMPTPLANRTTHLDVETDVDSWREWGINNGVEVSLLAFIAFRPDLLNTFEKHVKEKQQGYAFATERSWMMVDRLEKAGLPDDMFFDQAMGSVGQGPAAEYTAWRKTWQQMPNLDHILMDPTRAPVPEDSGTQYAVAVGLGSRATRDNLDVVMTYIERFDTEAKRPELLVLCLQDAIKRDSTLTGTAAFNKFGVKYAKLLGGR